MASFSFVDLHIALGKWMGCTGSCSGNFEIVSYVYLTIPLQDENLLFCTAAEQSFVAEAESSFKVHDGGWHFEL